jgi:hypothetical protein
MKDNEENTGKSEYHRSRRVDENGPADGNKNLGVHGVPLRKN